MSEYFKFEDASRDIPYYRHNPRISKTAWIVLLLTVPIAFICYAVIGYESEIIGSLLLVLVMLIPLLYYSGWDYSLIFHKPTRSEIKLAVILFIGYMIYAVVVGDVLEFIGVFSEASSDTIVINWEMTVSLVFSMMGEELMKFIPMMFLMRIFFKLTGNRKLSVIASSILIMIYFGLLHYDPTFTPLISALVIQGFGSIFEIYGYVKTKNLLVPYLCHFLTDAFIFIITLLIG